MRGRWGRAVGIAVVTAVGLLQAAGVEPRLADVEVVCPLFGHRFTAQTAVQDTDLAAFDADLCQRPPGTSPYLLAVWTCPYCFFSAYQTDFRGTLDPRFRDLKLRTYPIDAKKAEQLDIFPAIKYLNAEAFYRMEGKDARFLADLALRGSYACRLAEAKEPPEIEELRRTWRDDVLEGKRRIAAEDVYLEMAERIRQSLDAGKIAADRQRVTRYLLADALRQAGERIEAQSIFEALVKDLKLPDAYRSVSQDKAFLCEREGMFQQKALDYLKQAETQAEVPQSERAVVTYLEGELARRLGQPDAARQQYDRAAAMGGGPEWLPKMIARQRERLPTPPPAAAPAAP